MDLKDFLLIHFKNISWQNKYFNFIFRLLDIPDWIIRQINGLAYLPKYSIRVRSTGIEKQLGGKQLVKRGKTVADLLIGRVRLQSDQQVLEIGCGCGSAAFALVDQLQDGCYTGMDIDRQSIETCKQNHLFIRKGFCFDWMDVFHAMYNPHGKMPARSYRFPYPDEQFDVVFLISVFTHMLPADVSNYIREIGRMLKSQGKCFVTTFLMDFGFDGYIDFPFEHGDCRIHQEIVPEKAVGYYQEYLERQFNQNKLFLEGKPLLGQWRKNVDDRSATVFGQDILIFSKKS